MSVSLSRLISLPAASALGLAVPLTGVPLLAAAAPFVPFTPFVPLCAWTGADALGAALTRIGSAATGFAGASATTGSFATTRGGAASAIGCGATSSA